MKTSSLSLSKVRSHVPRSVMAMVFAVTMVGASASPNAEDTATAQNNCVDLREAPLISIPADKVAWKKHDVFPGAKALNTKSPAMTAYLEGSVTSEGVRIQIFDFPAGMASTPHMHPQAERAYVIEGAVSMVVGDGGDKDAIRYPAGSYYTVPARTRHYVFSKESAKVLSIMGGAYEVIPVDGGTAKSGK